jgi:cytochrome c oxidase assembly protein Cox11
MKKSPKFSSRGNQTGTSLIEVTLALGVVAFAVLPLMGSMVTGYGGYSSASQRTSESAIVNEIRVLVGDVTKSSQPIAPVFFTPEGVLTTEQDTSALYRAEIFPPSDTEVGDSPWETLSNRYRIVHLPSEKVTAQGVVHITPR